MRVIFLLLAGLAIIPAAADAQSGARRANRPELLTQLGHWHWGMSVGYGYGVDMSSRATFLGDVRFAAITAKVGWRVTDDLFEGSRLRGRVNVIAEGTVLPSLRPTSGFGTGVVVNPQYVFTGAGSLVPFVGIGSGPFYLDFNNPNQSDGLSFILQGGAGAEYFLTEDLALSGEIRLHHISNAGLRKPNPGINDILVVIGFSHHVF